MNYILLAADSITPIPPGDDRTIESVALMPFYPEKLRHEPPFEVLDGTALFGVISSQLWFREPGVVTVAKPAPMWKGSSIRVRVVNAGERPLRFLGTWRGPVLGTKSNAKYAPHLNEMVGGKK